MVNEQILSSLYTCRILQMFWIFWILQRRRCQKLQRHSEKVQMRQRLQRQTVREKNQLNHRIIYSLLNGCLLNNNIPRGALLLRGPWVNQVLMGSRPIWPTSGFRLGSPPLAHLHFRPCYSSCLLLCVTLFRPTCTALPRMLLRPRKS